MAELQIQIGANVSKAIAGLDKVQTELEQTGKSANVLSSSVGQAATTLQKLPQSANQAGTAVGNLSRIVQDAPFGFIAISNNLQPLFDDFTRLKTQTGSVGGAFKSLLGSIAGPAGIGLAFAAATSLITVFSKEIFGAGSAAKKAKSDVDEFNKSLDSAKASATSSGLQLQKFVEIAKDGNLPLSQRNEALEKANNILGDYGQKLTLANVATAQATELVQQYTQGLIAQALANQYADRAATLLINQAKAQQEVTKAQLNYNKAQQQFLNQPTRTVREQELGKGEIFITQRDAALKALNERQKEYAQITAEVSDITKQFNEQALKSTALLGGAGRKVSGGKIQIDYEPIIGISQRSILEAKEASRFEIGILTNAYQTRLEEGFKALKPVKVPLKIAPEIQGARDAFKALQEPLLQFNAAIDNINQNIASSVSGLFEGVGEALAGENITQKITSVFSTLLNAVGKALIQYGIVKEGLDKILGPAGFAIPGATAIGLGIAAIAASTLLKNFGGARADGGPVSGNTPYLVGERGPELFVPATSGKIVPNNQVPSFGGGLASMLGMGGRGGTTLRGQDIILASARTQRSQLRVNG
jgi:hypothetical protein